jgi:uncharacterized SAM-binding protein YcdF (DUF218 family)
MRRNFPRIACILLALLVVGYLGATFFVGSIVRTGVNRYAPSITQTPVRLEGARLSPLSGSGTLTGLFIGNPSGWSGDKAFYFGKIHVKVVPSSIFSDCVVLSEVTIDSPDFVYETRVISSNVGDLLKNIQGTSSGKSGSDRPVDKQGKPLKFIVKHFSLTNGRVTLGFGPTALTLPMPPVTLEDIGTREGGISPADLTLAVMRSVTGGIVSATTNAAGKIGSTMGAAAGNSAKSASDALKGLFGGNK